MNLEEKVSHGGHWSRQARLLVLDVVLSLQQWQLWTHLGWQDLLRQYRR